MTTTAYSRHVRLATLALTILTYVFTLPVGLAQVRGQRLNDEIQFEIPAQPLATALVQFSKQAKIQLVTSSVELGTQQTQGVTGRLPIARALDTLLERTELAYSLVGENTVAITPPANSRSEASGVQEQRADPDERVRLSQVDRESSAASPSIGQSDTLTGKDSDRIELEEIVVTGSHIRGSEPVGSNVIVFDREAIDRSGYGQIRDFVETLPQNFTGVSEDFTGATIGNSMFGTEIQLRGLGPGTTLTLINGQRPPGGGAQGGFIDISSIPVAAIERVEILPDGASAIYGSDAIGGVVNIILRRDLDAAETRMRYGTSGGDANEAEIAQLFGHTWSSGHVLLGYQFTDREALTRGDRGRLLGDLRPYGGTDHRRDVGAQRGGTPGNILNAAGQVAYAIPGGQSGIGLTVAELQPGVTNYQDVSYNALLPSSQMHSAFASLTQSFGDRTELLLNARYSTRDMRFPGAANGAVATVPATNPFYVNPFGGTAPVRVEYDFSADLGPQTSIGTNETFSVGIAPTVQLGEQWRLSLTTTYGEDRTDTTLINRLNPSAVGPGAAVWSDTNPATALNVFGNGTANNAATLEQILLPNLFEDVTNSAWSAGITADGPLGALPGGMIKVAVGAAYLSDDWHVTSNGANSVTGTVNDSRTDEAVFAEATLPLIGVDQSIPLVRNLDLSLAGRHDHYSNAGSTFNPKVGLAWRMVDALRLRGTWGTSFRAPPFYLSNLTLRPPSRNAILVLDPTLTSPTNRTNSLVLTGVVRDLEEETAELWTGGIDFTPLDRLSLSATYFDIRYDGRIGQPIDFNTVLVNEQQYAGTGLVITNPTQAQIDAICNSPEFLNPCTGSYGAIIDNRRQNIAVTRMRGLDADVNYGIDTRVGDLNFGVGGTYLFEYKEAITPASSLADRLDIFQRPISLRLRGVTSWALGRWTASAAVNYSGSYKVDTSATAQKIDSWTTVDLGIGYEFAHSNLRLLSGTEVRFSAINTFNELPPVVDRQLGFDPANSTMLGRTLSVQMAKKW